ncbi:hypothetical protein GCM10023093_29480 [Nemorincola caseinilytica]|uniref:TraB/GumN family protein n=1 Tax=Nemorincola caseinilytica TaxID=2054315 RepID=A0ABP8NMA8_9BACT
MRSFIPFLILLFALHMPAHAQETGKTLLWRITGNGLQKPSYLYGTMHLKARKLFDFPDSLYAALDNTEVFALEVNPDSLNNLVTDYADKLINKKEKDEDHKKEKKLRDILTPSELRTLRENLPAGSDIDPEELTVKQAYLMKDKLTRHRTHKDDMSTFVDAYLYSIAKDKDKIISGLERMEDQLNLLLETDMSSVDPKKMANYISSSTSIEDQMIEMYLDKDLDALLKLTNLMSEKQEDLLLTERNKTMLHSMDSIMQLHSLFSAVGALHLPGAHGLISLLRAKGYTVRPVMCNTYKNGADYKFRAEGANWVTVTSEKDGYSIAMPGQPNDINAGNGTVVMKMYFDLVSSKCYIVNHTNRPDTSTSPDELADIMAKSMSAVADDIESRPVKNGGLTGKEYFFKGKADLHYHMQILVNNTDIYMLGVYAQGPTVRNADAFFNSFRRIPKSSAALITRTFDDIRLTASVPDNKPVRAVEHSEDSSGKQTVYTIVDPALGVYYFIVCNEVGVGYNFNNDTVFVRGMKDKLAGQKLGSTFSKISHDGYNGYDIETDLFSNMRIKSRLLFCGNREYNALVQYPDNEKNSAGADEFLRSLRVIPSYPASMHLQMPSTGAFSTFAPLPFREDTADGPGVDTTMPYTLTYQCFDTGTLLTYDIRVKRLSPYYWNTDDTLMLRTWISMVILPTDSTPVYTYRTKDGMLYGEARAYKTYSDKIHRIVAISDGRTRYMLDCTYPISLKDDRRIDSFYSAFRVLKRDLQSLRRSSDALLADLHSADSATNARANKSIDEVFFSTNDLPILLREACRPFPYDTSSTTYEDISSRLFDLVVRYADSITLPQLKALYNDPVIARKGRQFNVLNMISDKEDTVAAYSIIKELLLTSPPAHGSSYLSYYRLRRHLPLVRTLYPELLQHCADSTISYLVCELAHDLLDSGRISMNEIFPYAATIIEKSRQQRQHNGAMPDKSLLHLLARIGSADAWKEIEQYQYINKNGLRYAAVVVLVDSQRTPAPAVLDSIAADRDLRKGLYDMLDKHGRISLFPRRFLKQEHFAESSISEMDYEGYYSNYTPIGTRMEMYKGKKQKFYLYDIEEIESGKHYLGVAGPYKDNVSLTIDSDDDASGMYEEPLDKTNVNNQLKVYLINKKIADTRNADKVSDTD